jgi:HAD superfamily hydrolase (TIGR01450 family)
MVLRIMQMIESRLKGIRHVALDMDGTIYRGGTLFETTEPFLLLLKEMGMGYTFLTNNPSKSIADYLAHLSDMGVNASEDQLYTSAQATIEFLLEECHECHRLFVLGTPSMCRQFTDAGFTLLPDSPDAEPDAVVVGFDLSLTYAKLCRAAWWISRGKPYFGTNPDRVCPTDQPTVLVDCGSIIAALQTATGRAPKTIFGKPDPTMIRGILQRHGLQPAQLAMIGDRLYTDMDMAHRAGALGVLVLTGESTAAEASAHKPAPDMVVADLEEFGARLRAAQGQRVPA